MYHVLRPEPTQDRHLPPESITGGDNHKPKSQCYFLSGHWQKCLNEHIWRTRSKMLISLENHWERCPLMTSIILWQKRDLSSQSHRGRGRHRKELHSHRAFIHVRSRLPTRTSQPSRGDRHWINNYKEEKRHIWDSHGAWGPGGCVYVCVRETHRERWGCLQQRSTSLEEETTHKETDRK